MKLPDLKYDNSLSEKVYQQLYKSLLTGKLRPGDKITETELASGMGISRSPIREALKQLANEHLIELVPRSGCYVTVLTEKDVDEIYEIRLRLECMALEYAFERLHTNSKRAVELMEEFKDCQHKEDKEYIKAELELDTKFHDLICTKSDCTNLQRMLGNLRTRLEIFRYQTTATSSLATGALKQHINIIQAILDGNKELALELLAEHIEDTKNNVLSTFNQYEEKK